MSLRSPLAALGLVLATGAVAVLTSATPAVAEESAHHDFKGRVTATSGLLLRDRPTRSSRIVGMAPYGSIVHIFCKTGGDHVNGNDLWYLLTDGTWAWASAFYIDNIGPAPRWC
ncbi:SH3 domain-containing protein [Streptomyces sp. NBC_01431]|uniref:SH3 domain-containing protein n=1 Tax=Streptomyces sp. NBC_01431 TaxID=2903863 RepID=UPI002E347F82|nr:SH3 domain-containing protein [Streptomyces sp. NBC_01431]